MPDLDRLQHPARLVDGKLMPLGQLAGGLPLEKMFDPKLPQVFGQGAITCQQRDANGVGQSAEDALEPAADIAGRLVDKLCNPPLRHTMTQSQFHEQPVTGQEPAGPIQCQVASLGRGQDNMMSWTALGMGDGHANLPIKLWAIPTLILQAVNLTLC
jgi:hypothetical protein